VNVLLDTHVLIWFLEGSRRLGLRTKRLLSSENTRAVVSAISAWEISIKRATGRLQMLEPLESWAPRLREEWGVQRLAITFDHAIAVRDLPLHHNDHFDRMLVAQAQVEGLAFVTADPAMARYDVRVLDARE
jgi:PIN domain nuclease of toxin-antitoxin system